MKTTRYIVTAGLCLALVTACSSGEAEEASASATDSVTGLTDDAATMPQGFENNALSGEVVLVADGLIQVQDGEYQTAVRYTQDTQISQEVTTTMSADYGGQCAVVIADEAGLATVVTLQDAQEDGSCDAGFGGLGGMPQGELPDGASMPAMPSAAPGNDDAANQDDAEGADSGVSGLGGGEDGEWPMSNIQFASGVITSASQTSLTVEAEDGTTTEFTLDSATTVTATVAADESALVEGVCVVALGEADNAGGYDATALTVSEPGEEGCIVARGAGFGMGAMDGMGGMSSGERPEGGSRDASSGSDS